LKTLDGKWHLLNHLLDEIGGVRRCSARLRGHHKKTGAVNNGCVLIQPLCNLAGIQLNAITGDWALIAVVALFAPLCFER